MHRSYAADLPVDHLPPTEEICPLGDPQFADLRISCMMEADTLVATEAPHASFGRVRPVPEPRKAVVMTAAEQSRRQLPDEPTVWLIAVRDARDRDAFAKLFDFYAPRLRAMLARQNCTGAAADDVIQDAMLRVWQKAGQFDASRASASAWIYRIARNRHVDVIRKTARPVPEALKVEEPPEPDASEVVGLQAEASRLRAALDMLNSEQRRIVEMAYMGELSHQQISDDTGLPLGTVKSRIRLALDRLRHNLKDLRTE